MKSPLQRTQLRLLAWNLVEAFALLLGGAGAMVVVWVALDAVGSEGVFGRGFVLLAGVFLVVLLAIRVCEFIRSLFGNRRLIRILEQKHPQFGNSFSTLDYVAAHPDEVERLGYSSDLIRALGDRADHCPEPDWDRLGLSFKTRGLLTGLCCLGVLGFVACVFTLPDRTARVTEHWLRGEVLLRPTKVGAVSIPDRLEAAIREEIRVGFGKADLIVRVRPGMIDEEAKLQVLTRRGGRSWEPIGTISESDSEIFTEPVSFRAEGPLEVCLAYPGGLSNVCRIDPYYPPTAKSFEATVHPPEYTGLSPITIRDRRRVEAIAGSKVEMVWATNNPLKAATLELLSTTNAALASEPLTISDRRYARTSRTAQESERIRVRILDRYGQTGLTEVATLGVVEDAPPRVEILSPTRETVLPNHLLIPTQALVSDNVGVASASLVYRVDSGLPDSPTRKQTLLTTAAGAVPSGTAFVFEPTLDLNGEDLWPGDRVVYWFEATDWRGEGPGVVTRSEAYSVRYPTVDESLDEMASMRARTTDGLEELLEEQREIGRQFEEVREDLQRNLSDKGNAESRFEHEKKLQETLDRQAQVEEQLDQAARDLDESLQRLSEDNELTLRTLRKFERVQELMDDVLSTESKKLLKEIQETLKKLQEDTLRPEDMERTETDLADFEKQLDRQIQLLENMWTEQELEALAEHAQELAERQQELFEETAETLAEEEREELAQEEAEAEAEAEKGEEGEQDSNLLEQALDELENRVEKMAQEVAQETASKEETESSDPSETPESSESETGEETAQDQPQEKEDLLAQRQEQLREETEKMLDELKRLQEKMKEEEHSEAENLESLAKSEESQSIPNDQRSSERKLGQKQNKEAAKKQSSASKKMAKLAQSMQTCCSGSDRDMEESIAKMKEILERSFVLSEESEGNDRDLSSYKALPRWPNLEKMSRMGERMGWYGLEATRLSGEFKTLAEQNPFADFEVVKRFDRAARNWRENTRVIEETPPLSVSTRSHQSLGQVNLAIEKLLESIQDSQAQCNSGGGGDGMEGYFRGLKEILQKQKGLNQRTRDLKEQMDRQGEGAEDGKLPGGKKPGQRPGMGMEERLQQMADQQRATRQMLEDLESRYQDLSEKPGSLGGVGDQMGEVEKDLEEGLLTDKVIQEQASIERRLLDAEKSMHTQGFKKSRRALHAGDGTMEGAAEEAPFMDEKKRKDLARLLNDNMEGVSPHWRDRVRAYYDELLRMRP